MAEQMTDLNDLTVWIDKENALSEYNSNLFIIFEDKVISNNLLDLNKKQLEPIIQTSLNKFFDAEFM